jgi:hypothetical protein
MHGHMNVKKSHTSFFKYSVLDFTSLINEIKRTVFAGSFVCTFQYSLIDIKPYRPPVSPKTMVAHRK